MTDLLPIFLIFLGLLSVILNTVVGGGAGVVLIPVLIIGFRQSANLAIGTTFVAITVGAVVAALAYSRQGRVDFRAGLLMAVLTLPGVVVGAFITRIFEGPFFNLILGVVVMVLAVLMFLGPRLAPNAHTNGGWVRSFKDSFESEFSYRINTILAVSSSVMTGFFAGIFGAGGGLILTPAMVLSGFPVHIALGTMRLIALVLAAGASATRLSLGQVDLNFAFWLSIGAVVGALLGARIARFAKSEFLRKGVSLIIFVIGLVLAFQSVL